MTPAVFQAETGVSRETLARLETYNALLRDWQTRMNLVGPRTLDDAWNRHFFDSAQLFALIPKGARTLVDLGSGAGFPGLVLSIMGVPETHLIESDQKKAAFLRAVIQETGAPATVHPERAESIDGLKGDIVTARALAPLARLLPLVRRFTREGSVALLPKGQHIDDELTKCAIPANISVSRVASKSDPRGTILQLDGWL